MVDENRREKEEDKKETAKNTSTHKVFLRKTDLDIFINAKGVWAISCLLLKKPCLFTSFKYPPKPSRTNFYTSDLIWAASQIK